MTTQFAFDLRLTRRKSGLKQEDVARLLAIDPSTVSEIEHARRLPTLTQVCAMSLIFGRSFESLFAQIMTDCRHDLLAKIELLPATARRTVRTFNRDDTLIRLERRLRAELARHEA